MILVTAALLPEALPIVRRLRSVRRFPGARAWRGQLDGGRVVVVLVTGVGAVAYTRTTAMLDAMKVQGDPAYWVLNIGTAGALRDDAPVGSVWCADAVGTGDRWTAVEPLPGFLTCRVLTVDRPVGSPTVRDRLATFATLCEMEAEPVRKAATGLRFSAIKVVSDLAGGDPDDPVFPEVVVSRETEARVRRRLDRLKFGFRALSVVERRLAPRLLPALTTR